MQQSLIICAPLLLLVTDLLVLAVVKLVVRDALINKSKRLANTVRMGETCLLKRLMQMTLLFCTLQKLVHVALVH